AIIDKEYGSGKSSQGRIQFNLHKRWQKHDVTALLASDISETYSGNRTLTRRYGFDTGNSTSASGLDYSTQYPIYGQLSGSLRIPEGNELIEGQVNRR